MTTRTKRPECCAGCGVLGATGENVPRAMAALHWKVRGSRVCLACWKKDLDEWKREPRRGHHVEVLIIGGSDPLGIARLMVNGYGVATWRANDMYGDSTGAEYAQEAARVLRVALGLPE